MANPAPQTPQDLPADRGRDGWGITGIGIGLVAILLLAAGLPVVGVGMQLVRGLGHPNSAPASETPVFVWGAVWNTAFYTLLIAVLATGLALPAAWMMRRGRAWWTALVAVPLLMPSYLAYAGWGLMRGPGSWVGDWLAHGSPARSLVFDKALAVGGMAMWGWPIGAFVVGAAARRIPTHLLDALDLEAGAAWRKWRVVGGMLAGSIGASIGLIALVMAGSAVPLHLAQVDTYAIHLWKYLNLTSDPAAVWPAATPLLVVAGIGAWVLEGAADRSPVEIHDEGAAAERRGGRMVNALAWVVWGVAVVVPMLLFLGHLRHWSSLRAFWGAAGPAMWVSGRNGAIVAAIVGFLAMGVWARRACCRCGGGFSLVRAGVWVMLAIALVPGVLVGSATLAFWNAPMMPRAAGDSMWPVILAHVARFGFVGVLAGWWMAGLETPDERGARVMLAGTGVRAWWTLCVKPQIGVVIGVALAAGALSLHEIESTVLLQPPGPSSLAQYMLDKLHYNRNEELCAACVNVMGVGIVLALAAGWLVRGVSSGSRSGIRR